MLYANRGNFKLKHFRIFNNTVLFCSMENKRKKRKDLLIQHFKKKYKNFQPFKSCKLIHVDFQTSGIPSV